MAYLDHCKNCHKPEATHLSGECLFDATTYVASTVEDGGGLVCGCTVTQVAPDGSLTVYYTFESVPIQYVTINLEIDASKL